MFKPACLFALMSAVLMLCTGCEILPSTTSNKPLAVDSADDDGFVSVFNGKDLTGWTPKIKGKKLGEDPKNTFRVIDGAISVRYDKYDKFNGEFGHLFLDTTYSSYILRLEYRFIGDKQIPGNPGGWAYMNSGVMIHGEDPKTMPKDKNFPDSIEVQLLGQAENVKEPRPTANICTPGTHYVLDGKLMKGHCKKSTSKTYRGEQWVKLEIEVHGSEKIIHRVNGEVVFEYTKPQLDNGTLLESGSISVQSESHECDFRNIEIKVLEK
jgi:hypothetical protein